MKLLLTAISGSREGETFTIEDKQCVTFGRTGVSNWSFEDDGFMSSIHFEVENLGNRAELRDRGSTNGTWLNDEKIAKETLREGDRIRAGKTILTIEFLKDLVPAVIVSRDEPDGELEKTVAPTPVDEVGSPGVGIVSPIAPPDRQPFFRSPAVIPQVGSNKPISRPVSSTPFDLDSIEFSKVDISRPDLPPPPEQKVSPFNDPSRRSHSPITDSSVSFPNPQKGSPYDLLARRTINEAADGLGLILDSLALKWSIQLVIHFQKIRIEPPRECKPEPIFKQSLAAPTFVPVRVAWSEASTAIVLPLMPRLCRADGFVAFLGQSAAQVAAQIELMSSVGVEGFSEPNGFLPFFWPSTLMSMVDARGIEICRELFADRIAGVIMCSPWSRNKVVAIADEMLSEDLGTEFQSTNRILGD